MPVEITVKSETVTAKLLGELDHHSAAYIREEIDNALDLNMPSRLVMDFENITFMDSSGIGLVLGRYRNLLKTGAALSIVGTSPQIYKVMRLAGIERLAELKEREK